MPNIKEDLTYYRKELAKIEPKVMALQETISGLEKLLNLELARVNEIDLTEIEVEKNAFNDLTTRDAALKGLFLISAPVISRQLAEFVEGHGFKHGSKNFANSMNTTLDRLLKNESMVSKGTKGWELTDKGRKYCDHKFTIQFQHEFH